MIFFSLQSDCPSHTKRKKSCICEFIHQNYNQHEPKMKVNFFYLFLQIMCCTGCFVDLTLWKSDTIFGTPSTMLNVHIITTILNHVLAWFPSGQGVQRTRFLKCQLSCRTCMMSPMHAKADSLISLMHLFAALRWKIASISGSLPIQQTLEAKW